MTQDVYSQNYGYNIQPFDTDPGSNRDTPVLDSKTYLDLKWCRFYAQRPRKMGGFKKIIEGSTVPVRAMFQVAIEDKTRVFLFRDTGVTQVDYINGSWSGEVDRTPIDWVTPAPGSPSLTFSVDSYTLIAEDTGESSEFIIFVAPPNSENPSQEIEAKVYCAPSNSDELFLYTGKTTSGGIIVSVPFIFTFGNNGIMYTNDGNSPFVWPDTGTSVIGVSNSKLLAGRRNRGGLLVWSVDTLFAVVPNTSGGGFTSSEVAPQISLLSPSSIVEGHNNTFYWVGNDQWYIFNGVAQPIPNTYNHNFFYDNLTEQYKGKVWGMYVGNYQELWFFTVEKGQTEPNRLFIYKMDENYWYDTELARTCGLKKKLLSYPLLADANPNSYSGNSSRSIWEHEKGYDVENDGKLYAIESYFQSKLFDSFDRNPQINLEMIIRKMEIDIIQKGEMNVQLLNYPYPKSEYIISDDKLFLEGQEQLDVSFQGRYVSFKFISNTVGGFYQMGVNQVNFQLGSNRP